MNYIFEIVLEMMLSGKKSLLRLFLGVTIFSWLNVSFFATTVYGDVDKYGITGYSVMVQV